MENWRKAIQNFKPAVEYLLGEMSGSEVGLDLQNQTMANVKETTESFHEFKIYKTIEEKFQVEALIGFKGNWTALFSDLKAQLPDQEESETEKMVYREITDTLSGLVAESLENTGIELRIDPFSEISSEKVKTVLNLQKYVVSVFHLNTTEQKDSEHLELVFAISIPNEQIVSEKMEKWGGSNQVTTPDFLEVLLNVAKNMNSIANRQDNEGSARFRNDEGTNVEFEPFDKSQDVKNRREVRNIDMLKDVEMQVSVELGRKKMPLGKILQLMKGSVIELEKLAGEPVDILVNGRCIAMGDVVVIDEHFGVRITRLMAAHESMKKVS